MLLRKRIEASEGQGLIARSVGKEGSLICLLASGLFSAEF